MTHLLSFFLLWVPLCSADKAEKPDIQFGADYYERDLTTNSVKAKGHAWFRSLDREVRADLIEIDFSTNRTIASGNVRMKEGTISIWSSLLHYDLSGEDAQQLAHPTWLENAACRDH